MFRNILIGFLALILAIILVLLAFIGIANMGVGAKKLTDEDFSKEWLSSLRDDTKINEIYIPGTHDSGALYSFFGISGKCQSYDIENQLDMGVRFFDIRLQLRENELMVVHSFVDQKQSFESVLKTVNEFLIAHPSEFVIMSIKQDADAENSNILFETAVENMLDAQFGNILSKETTLPTTLGEARGKVHIISRYANSSLGVPASNGWHDSTSFELSNMYVQDYYAISDIEAKMNDIRSAFDVAKEQKYSLLLNFTSCYLEKGFPPAHAPTTAKKINPQLLEILKSGKAAPCVFLCDFVNPELVGAIIDNNFSK